MDEGDGDQVDLWLAFAAGSDAWGEVEPPAVVTDQATRLIEVVGFTTAGTWPVLWLSVSGVRLSARDGALLGLLTLSLALLIRPLVASRARPIPPVRRAMARVILGGVALAGFAGLAPDFALLGAWPFGVAAGADVARTALVLGVPLRPRVWMRRLALSPAHVGVLVALALGMGLLGSRSGAPRIGLLYAMFWLCVLAAWSTASIIFRSDRRRIAAEYESERRIVEREHRRRGHWLHDDVCSDLRSVRLRIESRGVGDDDVAGLLDDLEHRLRVRQLDEFIDAGSVRLAEVLQPYLRRAQQDGVRIVESPTLETAGVVVSGETARLVQRAMGVLVPNVVHSGSPTLAVRLRVDAAEIVVEIEDRGGGFDLDTVPPGRGLDRLRHDLGAPQLECEPMPGGSTVRATILRQLTQDGAAYPVVAAPNSSAADGTECSHD